ncbi:hypothetical protein [Sphingomonas sp. KC8]|uniref:hypothetical protein n=1 Tax=Sphingomonas sp. KC8 TaxID=1030157 RepID=UPI0002489F93|nr:hypothetical protein [Sphingomonas sp. KC8]ARS26127.1 hypothetical protein KC8_02325 [Sphingomonas sp. KC8]
MLKLLAACAALIAVPTAAFAQAPAAVSAAPAPLSTATTSIGDLLENPQAKAILLKHLPEVVGSDQIEMARGMTLHDIQQYAPDDVTDVKLAAIDAELAKLKAGK